MAANTKIEWADASWNCLAGCTRHSAGCDHCYAATMTRRLEAMGQQDYAGLTTHKHFNGKVRTLPHKLSVPLQRKKPTRYFVNSMSDLFHKDVPDEFIDQVFAVMAICKQHQFLVLTKRPELMAAYTAGIQERRRGFWHEEAGLLCSHLPHEGEGGPLCEPYQSAWAAMRKHYYPDCCPAKSLGDSSMACPWPLPNVWLGCSCENQEQADKRIPHLLQTPAAVRFLSCEPLLEPVNLLSVFGNDLYALHHGISWDIVGGESGPGARPCQVEWIRSIVQQCKDAGTACFVKQLGAHVTASGCTGQDEHWPRSTGLHDTGKGYFRKHLVDKKGGNMDEWPDDLRVREFPEVKA